MEVVPVGPPCLYHMRVVSSMAFDMTSGNDINSGDPSWLSWFWFRIGDVVLADGPVAFWLRTCLLRGGGCGGGSKWALSTAFPGPPLFPPFAIFVFSGSVCWWIGRGPAYYALLHHWGSSHEGSGRHPRQHGGGRGRRFSKFMANSHRVCSLLRPYFVSWLSMLRDTLTRNSELQWFGISPQFRLKLSRGDEGVGHVCFPGDEGVGRP